MPPLTNELVLLCKDSSLAFLSAATGERELRKFGRGALKAKGMTPIIVAGLCYLIITIPLSLPGALPGGDHGAERAGGTE